MATKSNHKAPASAPPVELPAGAVRKRTRVSTEPEADAVWAAGAEAHRHAPPSGLAWEERSPSSHPLFCNISRIRNCPTTRG